MASDPTTPPADLPEATRLADLLEAEGSLNYHHKAAAELRRLHALTASAPAASSAAAPAVAPADQAALFDAQGFRDFVLRDMPDDTIIGSSSYWADHLTAWAKCFVKTAPNAPQAGAESYPPTAVAHRMLRKNGAGQWVHDAKTWADGPAPADLVADVEKHPDLYRIENAYSDATAALRARGAVPSDSPSEAVERIAHLRGDRDRRVYVAGPMTGLPEYNFPLFNSTAARLRAEGWHVENPAEHGHVAGAGWADYLRWDISRIVTCGAIYLLPGWSASKGAALEAHISGVLGLQVLYADGAEPLAAPAAPMSAQAPGGWKLVPVEPSREMLDAYVAADGRFHSGRADWAAMLAAAPQPPAAPGEQDARDAAFEAVRQRLCKLPRYSFALDSRGNLRRCEEKSGNWIEFDAAHALFDPIAVDAAMAAKGQEGGAA